MRLGLTLLIAIGFLFVSSSAVSAPAPKISNSSAEAANNKKSAVSTSHNFEDLLVQGKYHFSDESVTTVEEDKVLDALIGVRSDFKDRLKKSTARK
jgi:hypothetical protein